MQIGELAKRLDIPYRAVRYTLERGHADHWVRAAEGSGNHRSLNGGEAFALGLLLKLKAVGLQAPKVEKLVSEVEGGLRFMARGLEWDHHFDPFRGNLETKKRWVLELGDDVAFRLVTDANPSGGGKMEEFRWADIRSRRTVEGFEPCVTIKIDLSRFSKLVQEKPAASAPDPSGRGLTGRKR